MYPPPPQIFYLNLNLTNMYCKLIFLQECIGEFFQCIKCLELHSDEDVLKMKTALWAVVCQNKKVTDLRKKYMHRHFHRCLLIFFHSYMYLGSHWNLYMGCNLVGGRTPVARNHQISRGERGFLHPRVMFVIYSSCKKPNSSIHVFNLNLIDKFM